MDNFSPGAEGIGGFLCPEMLKITLCSKKVTKIFGSLQLFCYLCIVKMTKEFFNTVSFTMRFSELTKRLSKAGCYVTRHGARHDLWFSPITGLEKAVPRHGSQEVKTGLLKAIEKELLGL